MTITNGYATLQELKAWFGISTVDPLRDASIEAIIEDTSREIDAECHRVFYGAAPASARYYTPRCKTTCYIDSCTSITSIATDDGTGTYPYIWAASDYFAMPANGTHIDWIETRPTGNFHFVEYPNNVKVTAVWGYNLTGSHPSIVRRALLIQAGMYFRRSGTVYSVAGGENVINQVETKEGLLPEVMSLINPYIKQWGG